MLKLLRLFPSRLSMMLALLLPVCSGLVSAQVPREFNACDIFTAEDAAAVLSKSAEVEVPKGKPPKFIPSCTYSANVDGKNQTATAVFRFMRSPAEATSTLKETRLEVRGRSLIVGGQDAYWHPKQTYLAVVKGQLILTLTVGPQKDNERLPDAARTLAERLLPKIQ